MWIGFLVEEAFKLWVVSYTRDWLCSSSIEGNVMKFDFCVTSPFTGVEFHIILKVVDQKSISFWDFSPQLIVYEITHCLKN